MELVGLALPLAWLTLMGAPAFVFIVRFKPSLSNQLNVVRATILIALVMLAWRLSVDFLWRPLNWLALAAAYFGWALLVGSAFSIRPRLIGSLLGILGLVTFLPGLALSTIGFLALAWSMSDYASSPSRSVTLGPGLDCAITDWGSAVTDDGHDVHLYRYFTWFPLLRHQVRDVVVDETHLLPGLPASTGCEAVAAGRTS